MILERLKELAQRVSEEIPPPGYAKMKIRWIIELNRNGKLLGAIKTEGEGGKPKFVERMAPNPNLTGKRAVNIKAGLLADTAEYALGKPSESKDAKPERLGLMHEDFCSKISACVDALPIPEVIAVQSLLAQGALADNPLLSEIDGGDWVTFRVDGMLPIDLPRVREYWAQSQSETKHSGTCMICGSNNVALVDLQPVALKSVPGGQSTGVQLISANTDVFESYGLQSALIAPMCRPCAELSHNAINYLISSKRNSFRVSDKAILLFWTREPMEFHLAALFNEPTEENVKELLKAPYTGKAANAEFAANKFYMLALSGSGGRAVVRDWIETVLSDVQTHMRNYFIGQHIDGGREPYQKLMGLAGATVRDLDQLAPWVSLALAEHALKGTLLPTSLLATAVRRCAVGKVNMGTRKREHVSAQQAALVKLCLRSLNQQNKIELPEDWMVKLDTQCEQPAYLYGRLFNVLEQIQEGATGGESVERTFGTAVMSPVSTLPRLIARSNVHLRKLKRDKPGFAVILGKLMNEIQSKISTKDAYLTRLDAAQQGLFVLGYWHQNAAKFEKRTEAETIEQ